MCPIYFRSNVIDSRRHDVNADEQSQASSGDGHSSRIGPGETGRRPTGGLFHRVYYSVSNS